MPDVRTLLEEATARPATHPDPVGAVHSTVRRTRRRRVAGAGLATFAVVAAAGVVATGLAAAPDRERVEPAVTEGNLHFDTGWRGVAREPDPYHNGENAYWRLRDLFRRNPEVFVGMNLDRTVKGEPPVYEVAFSAGADPDEWADELATAAGDRELRVEQCDRTAASLDRVASDVLAAPFPSGARVAMHASQWSVGYRFPCAVEARLDAEPTAADHAYALARWEDDVVLVLAPNGLVVSESDLVY